MMENRKLLEEKESEEARKAKGYSEKGRGNTAGKRERRKKEEKEAEKGIEAVMDLIIVEPRKTRDRSEMLS